MRRSSQNQGGIGAHYNHAAVTLMWGLAAAVAMLWPARISGPLDGMPLDHAAEAVTIGLLFPLLCWFHPRFLATRFARTCIVALLAWKALTSALLVPDGWCVRVIPSRPYVRDATGMPHSWDVRADWRSRDPACSAIMTRSYRDLHEFPVWFFNLPPDAPDGNFPVKEDGPPAARVGLIVQGFVDAPRGDVLRIATGPDITAVLRVDGSIPTSEAPLDRGVHTVTITAQATGDRWELAPTVDEGDLWSNAMATVNRPSRFDRVVRPWGRWIPAALVGVVMAAWTAAVCARIGSAAVLLWMIGAASVIGGVAWSDRTDLAGWTIAALIAATLVPVPHRLRNVFGALVMIGVPWLTYVVVRSAPLIGRLTLYEWGNDFWTFQRYAYRIVMQGYWLEGGSPTFWFQPLYRWIAGVLHVIFGDSSVGEWYWDGACLLAGALAAFRLTKTFAGFRWGLAAAVATLATFMLGTARIFVGRGLGEISSAGFMYLAIFFVLGSRNGNWRAALAGGALATLGVYTRLNNLIMALGVCVFALPPRATIADMVRRWPWSSTSWRTITIIVATVGTGMLLFATRTWHYTGVFSVFYGTARDHLAVWQPGISMRVLLTSMMDSVMMVLTVNDPPQWDPYALPVLAGGAVSALAIAGLPVARRLPAAVVLFFFAAIAGAFIARGSAYAGRFSIHVIPVTSAAFICALASATVRVRAITPATRKSPAQSRDRSSSTPTTR